MRSKLNITIACFLCLVSNILFAQSANEIKGEHLKLEWPKEDHWKVANDQATGWQHSVNMVHEGESIYSWTELGNMTSIKGVTGIPVDTAMYMMFLSAVAKADNPKVTKLQKGVIQDCEWILFSIEAPSFKNDTIPESQLWYVIQGKQGLYTNFVAVKNATLPDAFKQKWTTFFLNGRLIYD